MTETGLTETRYLIVSTDGHVSPSLRQQLRKFCPPALLADYDAYAAENEAEVADNRATRPPAASDKFWRTKRRMLDAPGIADPAERVQVMDADGIAAEVLFAGAGGKQKVPFVGTGHNAGNRATGDTLIAVGCSIWNDGLAEYCSHTPTGYTVSCRCRSATSAPQSPKSSGHMPPDCT